MAGRLSRLLAPSLRREKGVKIGRFYARRAFRIFPLYYATLLLIAQLPQKKPALYHSAMTPHHNGINWREWVYLTNYPMDLNNVMYWSWSLSVEEHFYLAVPFLLLGLQALGSPKLRLWALGGLWLSCLGVKALAVYLHWSKLPTSFFNQIYFPSHTRYDELVAGIFAAYLHQLWPQKMGAFFRSWRGRTLAWGLTLTTLAAALSQFSVGELALRERAYYLKGAFLVGTPTSLAFAALILWAVYDGGKLLGHRLLLHVATLSYGIYLIHIPVIEQLVLPWVVRPALDRGWNFYWAWASGLCTTLPLVLFFAYLLHLIVEKPMLLLRDRWAPRQG